MVAILQTTGAPTRADFHAAITARADRWFSVCMRITRDPDMAEDALQDALLSAWNKRHQFDNSARLDTWMHRIVVNAALQLLRRNRLGSLECLETDVPDDSERPEDARAEEELCDKLSAALAHLTEIERVCFVLKHLEQWRLQEIADEIGGSIGAVKQAVFRAVRKLRPKMTGLRGDWS